MAKIIEIHPVDPQPRRVAEIVETIREGGLIAYPTDSSYAFGCHIGDKRAMDRIRRIRRTDKHHNFTLVCADLSEISVYARVDNWAYRLIRSLTPGPYTFILPATRQLPKILANPKRRTIGIRVPDHPIVAALLIEHAQPLMSTTLILPGNEFPETDAFHIRDKLESQVDLIIDAGPCGLEFTTVVDLTESIPQMIRYGKGSSEGLT